MGFLVPLLDDFPNKAQNQSTASVLVVQVIETMSRSSHIDPGAGLVFVQYSWLRHSFLLNTHRGEAVQHAVRHEHAVRQEVESAGSGCCLPPR